jgi:hypothetical protein
MYPVHDRAHHWEIYEREEDCLYWCREIVAKTDEEAHELASKACSLQGFEMMSVDLYGEHPE